MATVSVTGVHPAQPRACLAFVATCPLLSPICDGPSVFGFHDPIVVASGPPGCSRPPAGAPVSSGCPRPSAESERCDRRRPGRGALSSFVRMSQADASRHRGHVPGPRPIRPASPGVRSPAPSPAVHRLHIQSRFRVTNLCPWEKHASRPGSCHACQPTACARPLGVPGPASSSVLRAPSLFRRPPHHGHCALCT